MISTMPKNNHMFLKLLLVAAAIYGYKNKAEISHGISDFFAKNQMIQEAKSSLKWAYDELRPATEAEKAQHEAFAKRQREVREEYKKMGVNPGIRYVDKNDPEWKETAEFIGKLKRGEVR